MTDDGGQRKQLGNILLFFVAFFFIGCNIEAYGVGESSFFSDWAGRASPLAGRRSPKKERNNSLEP